MASDVLAGAGAAAGQESETAGNLCRRLHDGRMISEMLVSPKMDMVDDVLRALSTRTLMHHVFDLGGVPSAYWAVPPAVSLPALVPRLTIMGEIPDLKPTSFGTSNAGLVEPRQQHLQQTLAVGVPRVPVYRLVRLPVETLKKVSKKRKSATSLGRSLVSLLDIVEHDMSSYVAVDASSLKIVQLLWGETDNDDAADDDPADLAFSRLVLSRFAHIVELDLSYNNLETIAGIAQLPNLRQLNLSRNHLDRLPDELLQLSQLELLNLEHLWMLGEIPQDMNKLAKLAWLSFRGCMKLSLVGVKLPEHLRYLDFGMLLPPNGYQLSPECRELHINDVQHLSFSWMMPWTLDLSALRVLEIGVLPLDFLPGIDPLTLLPNLHRFVFRSTPYKQLVYPVNSVATPTADGAAARASLAAETASQGSRGSKRDRHRTSVSRRAATASRSRSRSRSRSHSRSHSHSRSQERGTRGSQGSSSKKSDKHSTGARRRSSNSSSKSSSIGRHIRRGSSQGVRDIYPSRVARNSDARSSSVGSVERSKVHARLRASSTGSEDKRSDRSQASTSYRTPLIGLQQHPALQRTATVKSHRSRSAPSRRLASERNAHPRHRQRRRGSSKSRKLSIEDQACSRSSSVSSRGKRVISSMITSVLDSAAGKLKPGHGHRRTASSTSSVLDELRERRGMLAEQHEKEQQQVAEDLLPATDAKQAREPYMTAAERLISAYQQETLPADAVVHQHLRSVYFVGTMFSRLPPSLMWSPSLTKLTLSHCSLDTISLGPGNALHCPMLTTLVINWCMLSHLPLGLDRSDRLQHLDLASNKITSLESPCFNLRRLSSLQVLVVSDNKLTILPRHMRFLQSLQVLNVAGNQLASLPRDLAALTALRVLDASRNLLSMFPYTPLQNLDLPGKKLARLHANSFAFLPDADVPAKEYWATRSLQDPSLFEPWSMRPIDAGISQASVDQAEMSTCKDIVLPSLVELAAGVVAGHALGLGPHHHLPRELDFLLETMYPCTTCGRVIAECYRVSPDGYHVARLCHVCMSAPWMLAEPEVLKQTLDEMYAQRIAVGAKRRRRARFTTAAAAAAIDLHRVESLQAPSNELPTLSIPTFALAPTTASAVAVADAATTAKRPAFPSVLLRKHRRTKRSWLPLGAAASTPVDMGELVHAGLYVEPFRLLSVPLEPLVDLLRNPPTLAYLWWRTKLRMIRWFPKLGDLARGWDEFWDEALSCCRPKAESDNDDHSLILEWVTPLLQDQQPVPIANDSDEDLTMSGNGTETDDEIDDNDDNDDEW